MRLKSFYASISTLGKIGYLPAPGTMATIVTIPAIVLIENFSFLKQLIFLILLIFFSFFFIKKAIPFFHQKYTQQFSIDPSEIVLDEVVGCFITFFYIPLTINTIIIGFILFRFFDITKPLGIKNLEKLNGAKGILLDDIAAGVISNLLLRIFLLFNSLF